MSKIDFPKVLISKTPKTYKSKKLNNANFGNFHHTDYQVFLHLVSKIGGVDKYGKYLQPEQLKKEYVLTAKEFSELFNVSLPNCYGILKQAVDKLMKTDLKVERVDLQEIWRINICSMAKYNNKQGTITINFTDHIMPYLVQEVKKKFILYNLKEIANFGSLYTTRLYELIQEFKETGWMLKTVEQLREAFAVGDKFKLYGHFKTKTFAHACQEINANYDIDLRFEEIKKSRKVVAIRFSFKPVVINKITNHKTGITRNIYKKPTKLQLEKKEREMGLSKLSDIFESQFSFDNMKFKQK